jgi:hypothetical protein
LFLVIGWFFLKFLFPGFYKKTSLIFDWDE